MLRQLRTPPRGHKAKDYTFVGYSSNRARPRKEKPCARRRSGETIAATVLEPFSQGIIDNDAALMT